MSESTTKPESDFATTKESVYNAQPSPSTIPVLARFEDRPNEWDFSPWVNRLEALLTFSNTPFELETKFGNPITTPRGRLPIVKLQSPVTKKQETIPDSLFAYRELVKRGLANDLDTGLSADEMAKSRAIQSLLEEIYLLLLSEGWIDHFKIARDKLFLRTLPYPIRMIVGYLFYRKMCLRRELAGLKNRPASEIDFLRNSGMDAIATWVGEGKKHILGGETPTEADAIVFAYLATIYANPEYVYVIMNAL
ncbi:hypothetical protein DL93DRAFT_2087729, partial [Clavulina sp. PMI_390]